MLHVTCKILTITLGNSKSLHVGLCNIVHKTIDFDGVALGNDNFCYLIFLFLFVVFYRLTVSFCKDGNDHPFVFENDKDFTIPVFEGRPSRYQYSREDLRSLMDPNVLINDQALNCIFLCEITSSISLNCKLQYKQEFLFV